MNKGSPGLRQWLGEAWLETEEEEDFGPGLAQTHIFFYLFIVI